MAKKIFLTTVSAIIFLTALTTIGFAKSDDNTSRALGDEVTESMNKTERSMDDLVDETNIDKAGKTIKDGAKALGNTVRNGMDDMGRTVEEIMGVDSRTDNKSVVGTTGNFASGEVQVEETTNRNGMTQNAWIWIVMVVVALIIVAAVWFYAAQK